MITPLVITWHSESQLGGISGGINLNLALKALVGKGVRVSPKAPITVPKKSKAGRQAQINQGFRPFLRPGWSGDGHCNPVEVGGIIGGMPPM